MLNIIPRPVHAVLDYVYGATGLAAPKLLGFENDNKAKMISTVVGAFALMSALTTRHEGGVIKMVPFNTHLKLDVASALLSIAAPWLLGFSNNNKARNAIIGLALLQIAVAALSQPDVE